MGKIVVQTVFEVAPEKIWQALTDPQAMKGWYFDIADFKLERGHEFAFYENGGSTYLHRCEILDFEPNHFLQYSWSHPQQSKGSSVLRWQLETYSEGKTELTLTHEGIDNFADAGPNFSPANFEMGWNALVKTSLRNYLYGIKKLVFSQDIHAPATHVWKLMWDKQTYTEWVAPFCEGTYFTGEIAQGNRIHFLAPSGSGMYSDVFYLIPGQLVIFRHIGMIENQNEMPLDAETEKWTGSFETYKLNEADGITMLTAEIDCVPQYLDYMNEKFPLALQKLKEISEA